MSYTTFINTREISTIFCAKFVYLPSMYLTKHSWYCFVLCNVPKKCNVLAQMYFCKFLFRTITIMHCSTIIKEKSNMINDYITKFWYIFIFGMKTYLWNFYLIITFSKRIMLCVKAVSLICIYDCMVLRW